MTLNNQSLLKLFETNGIEEGIKQIDIEKVPDDIIKIILRTIKGSSEILMVELENRVRKS